MKFKIQQTELNRLIKGVLPAINKKEHASGVKYCSRILIEAFKNALIVTGADIPVSIKIKGEAEIFETGALGVSGKAFFDPVTNFPDILMTLEVISSGGGHRLRVSGGRKKIHLNIVEPDIFPPSPRYENFQFMDAGNFFETVDKVIHCVSKDETRPILMGIGLKNNKMFATNGFTLALHPYSFIPGIESIIIPADCLMKIRQTFVDGDLGVFATDSFIHFQQKDRAASIRLISRDYPAVEQAIPKTPYSEAKIKKEDLIKALSLISIVANSSNNRGVVLSFSSTGLKLFSNSESFGDAEETVECESTDEREYKVNCSLLQSLISKLKHDVICFELREGKQPLVLKEGEYVQLVMPLTI